MDQKTGSTDFTGPELCRIEAHEAVALLKKGEVSPAELLDAALMRIAQVEPSVNAMPTLCEERARRELRKLDERRRGHGGEPGFLAGLPIAVKDLTMVAGVRATMGSLAFREFVPDASEPLVERLEARGGVVVGKTNTPEFGAGANTFNEVFGHTRNPWNTSRNAGGSSGGAAVSLATGEIWLSHGSDHGGSLRTPAAYCGVVGMRPSPGRAGGAGPTNLFDLESVDGPMARTVADLALFLDAMAGYDAREPITIEAPREPFQEAVRRATAKVRIAFAPDLGGFAPVEAEIRDVLATALTTVGKAGANVDEACPRLPKLYETYMTLRNMGYAAVRGRAPEEVQRHYKQSIRRNIEAGRKVTADDIYDAQQNRSILYEEMRLFLDDFDVLACPVVGLEPLAVEVEYPREVAGKEMAGYVDWLRFAFLATTTTLPALALPVGFTASGMPVGLQLIGPPRGEAKLLAVARAVEDAVGFRGRTPIDPRPPRAG